MYFKLMDIIPANFVLSKFAWINYPLSEEYLFTHSFSLTCKKNNNKS